MKVIKQGILDTFQDSGRFGYAHLGVGQGGCMDQYAGQLANILVGNPSGCAVLEMHFPAPMLEFETSVTIALTGADFNASVHGIAIPNNRRVQLPAISTLVFKRKTWGQRCYLAVQGGWSLEMVMGSYSTHVKAGFGGFEGRALRKGDLIPEFQWDSPSGEFSKIMVPKWFAGLADWYNTDIVRVLKGPEWNRLTEEAMHLLTNSTFTISRQSDRMGYQLQGLKLKRKLTTELLSSGVLPGTVQLLPDGQPLVLMTDCQTTGGYPRILQVIEAELPVLAQKGAGEIIKFEIVEMEEALELKKVRIRDMEILKSAIQFR